MKRKKVVTFFEKAAILFDEPNLNSSLCLIFNGMASMIAIAFLILYFMGKTSTLFYLGIGGFFCMMLANITDLIPFWLKSIAKKIDSGKNNS